MREARAGNLPAGPAPAAVVSGAYRLPPEFTGESEPIIRTVFRTEFHIPTFDGQALVFLTISPDNPNGSERLSIFAEQAMSIAHSIRIAVPDAE